MHPINPRWVEADSDTGYHDKMSSRLEGKNDENGKKNMGRPRNAWSPSRLRKTIRLYTMTALNIVEIKEVIRTKHFMPCKRDIQKQLQAVFQIRPNKIRSRGNSAKLLKSLRECRPIDTHNLSQINSGTTDYESMGVEAVVWDEKVPSEVGLHRGPDANVRRNRRRLREVAAGPDWGVTTTITAGDSSCQLIQNMSVEEAMEGRRFTTFTIESCQGSVVSNDSLRGRLAHKTQSCVDDVISVLQNFTISGSSVASQDFDMNISWNSPNNFLGDAEKQRNLESIAGSSSVPLISQQQVLLDHKLSLPGQFASHSVEFSLSAPWHMLTSLWKHTKEQALVSGFGHADWNPMLNEMDGADSTGTYRMDSFGHSILHIAAANGERLSSLLDIIALGAADVHARNSGGETFLHLVRHISSLDCMHLQHLLPELQRRKFDFSQRDDHGQTPLHVLSRRWENESSLECIVDSLLSSGVAIPLSRDNLGRTVLRQITDVGLELPAITQFQLSMEHAVVQPNEEQSITTARFHELQKYCLPNYGSNTYIETMKDLQLYEVHADFLRTIRRAISFPQYEDDLGRNGLHCLAEVSLSLPIPNTLPSSQTTDCTPREAYLSSLIEAKVDPDNCNKAGATPLMAFIIHTRENEDEETTIRILSRLHDAGANLDRRDRKGQTPLHVAVSLGKVAITKFLVVNGANIHARDSKGKSVICMGKESGERTSNDVKLYAQIMICIAIVVDAGGVSNPTDFQEWAQK